MHCNLPPPYLQPNHEVKKAPVLQINDSGEANHITDEDGKLGLYVDSDWKVKATKLDSSWDKFTIQGFAPNDK